MQEEGWVVCRVFKKRMTTMQKMGEQYDQSHWYDDQVSFMQDLESPNRTSHPYNASYHNHHHPCKPELEMQYNNNIPHHLHDSFLQLPQLESPKFTHSSATTLQFPPLNTQQHHQNQMQMQMQMQMQYLHQQSLQHYDHQAVVESDQVTDWRVLDKFVASQLSHDDQQDVSKEASFSNASILHVAEQITLLANGSKKAQVSDEHASTSTSSCQMELWK